MTLIAWQATVQDDEGNVIVNPSITVRRASDNNLADIFDAEGDALDNPFIGSSEGFVQFFAQPGKYTIQGARGGSVTQTWTVDLASPTGKQYATRAEFVADVAGGYAPADGTVVTAGGAQYVRSTGATDLPGLPGWLPFGVVTPLHFGVRVDDPSAATQNVERINSAEEWAAENNAELVYPAGVIYCQGRVIWRDRVYRRGVGVQPNWRPAPVTIGASTPIEQFRNQVGCELRFIGAGVKDLTFPWITNGHHSGFGRVNPRRAYDNSFDERLDLRDFSNQDASGTTPATLKQLSAAVVIKTNTLNRIYCEGITIRTACDGVSADGGTGLEGYEVRDRLPDWADYDIGLLVDSPWQSEFYRLSVLGYWNEAGVLWSASRNAPEFGDSAEAFRGYAEGNIWRHCIVQSGWVYRTADTWPILAKDEVENTLTVPWTASHQFESAGVVRAGRSFTSFETYNYSGITFDDSGPEHVLVLQMTSSVEDIEVGNNGFQLFFSGGAGPATSSVYDCEFYDLSPTSLLHEPAYDRPYKAGCEISGGVARAIRLYNTILHSHGFMPIIVGYAPDLQLSDCYIEPRRFRITHGGALEDRGGLFICGPEESKRALLGTRWNGSVYARGYFQWPGLNMAPLMRVTATGWFGDIEGDWFNPRSYSPPIEQVSRTSRATGLEGLRDQDIRLVGRRNDGAYYPGVVVKGDSGTVLLGRRVTGGDDDEDGPAQAERTQLLLPLGGAAVLRNNLHLTDTFSTGIKDIRNDNNGLGFQHNPTGDGLRYVGSTAQLRLRRSDGAALQVHRPVNGRVAEWRRDGVISGGIEVYAFGTRYTVDTAGNWQGMPFTTVGRPTAPYIGFNGFDTTLGIPVWWDGSAWVDATGATV